MERALSFPALSAKASLSQLAEPSFYWTRADYDHYLEWVHETFGSHRYKTVTFTYTLDRILRDSGLTQKDISSIRGRVLLAGEGDISSGGLYSAFVEARGGHSLIPGEEVVALDLLYGGRFGSIVEGTVTRMPFHDNSFRFISSYMVAHYLRSQTEMNFNGVGLARNAQSDFVLEVARVLEPGGEARIGPFLQEEIPRLIGVVGTRTVDIQSMRLANGTFMLTIKKGKI